MHKEKEETYWKLELPLCIKTTLIKLIKKLILKTSIFRKQISNQTFKTGYSESARLS